METRVAAIEFIKSLSEHDKEEMRKMISHGVMCGADFARMNGIDPFLFNEELKLVFGGK